MRKGNKSAEKKKSLANVNVLFNARNNAIKFIEDYRSMILEAKRQIKAGKSSESLLNAIRQFFYSLYQAQEITKKVYKNIIKSIKV